MRKILDRVVDGLGLLVMGERYRRLTVMYLLLAIYVTMESVFVNTLLQRTFGDIVPVILYRAVLYISSAVAMNLAAIASQKTNPVFVLRIGTFLYLTTYVGLVFGMKNIEHLYLYIAALSGISNAFYWSGHNSLVLEYSTRQNRDLGIGIFGIITGVITLVIPLITGVVISLMPGNWGYSTMFAIGMIAALIQMIFSSKLQLESKNKDKTKKSEFRLALKLIKEDSTLKLLMTLEVFRGLRDGVFSFVLNMLLFEIVASETLTGINTFLTGIVAIIGSMLYSKLVQPRLRSRYIVVAVSVILVFIGILSLNISVFTIMLFTAVNSLFQLFIINSYNNAAFDTTSQNPRMHKAARELFGIREISITFGRAIGLAFALIIPKTNTGYIVLLASITAVQYINAILLNKITTTLDEREKETAKIAELTTETTA